MSVALELSTSDNEGSDVVDALDDEDTVDDFDASDDGVELGES